MVHSCCAYGCKNRFQKGKGTGFYRFPRNPERRLQWMLAVRRKNFEPYEDTRICGQHFLSGRPSPDPNDPDYVPSVFVFNKPKTNVDLSETSQNRTSDEHSSNSDDKTANNDCSYHMVSLKSSGVIIEVVKRVEK